VFHVKGHDLCFDSVLISRMNVVRETPEFFRRSDFKMNCIVVIVTAKSRIF